MSAGHTPGPWSIEDVSSGKTLVYYKINAGNSAVGFAGSYKPDGVVKTPGEAAANARLIAAAPELLEALEGLCAACELRANREGGDYGPEIGPYAYAAEIAIAKAKGGAK